MCLDECAVKHGRCDGFLYIMLLYCSYTILCSRVTPDGHVMSPPPVEHGDSFLLILSEVWLGQNAYSPQLMYPTAAPSRPLTGTATTTSYTMDDLHFQIPSLQLSDSIHHLIIHLLSDPAYQPFSSSSSPDDTPIGMSLALQSIQKSLFHFLRTAFLRWPHDWDARFSAVIEIWLAYIQPWVATDAYQPRRTKEQLREYDIQW